jgi:hypothetical protein
VTRIVIERVRDREDLMEALSVLLEEFNKPGAFEVEEQVFRPLMPRSGGSPGPVRVADLEQAPGSRPTPLALTPCPDRGTHLRLTDCWRCWSDVMRGAALEPEVLAPGAWDGPES